MNHDISHCNFELCPKKYSCIRYLAHIEIKENQDKFKDMLFSYLSDPEKSCLMRKFKMYWSSIEDD